MICDLCPRGCKADRGTEVGYCGAGEKIRVARAALHMWEEPVISAKNGSGTVFFSGCALRCGFCQNAVLSRDDFGVEIDEDRLYRIFFELKEKGAHNINLVTADHYIPQIMPPLRRAKRDGLSLPIILNTSSYLRPRTVDALRDTVDIYIADMKFSAPRLAKRYCNAEDYPTVAKEAIERMVRTKGAPVTEDGVMQSGVIVRVLVMPECVIDAKMSVKYLYETYGDEIYISVMGQYVPIEGCPFPELNRRLTEREYRSVTDYAARIGVTRGFTQDITSADAKYIPPFDLEGVK